MFRMGKQTKWTAQIISDQCVYKQAADMLRAPDCGLPPARLERSSLPRPRPAMSRRDVEALQLLRKWDLGRENLGLDGTGSPTCQMLSHLKKPKTQTNILRTRLGQRPYLIMVYRHLLNTQFEALSETTFSFSCPFVSKRVKWTRRRPVTKPTSTVSNVTSAVLINDCREPQGRDPRGSTQLHGELLKSGEWTNHTTTKTCTREPRAKQRQTGNPIPATTPRHRKNTRGLQDIHTPFPRPEKGKERRQNKMKSRVIPQRNPVAIVPEKWNNPGDWDKNPKKFNPGHVLQNPMGNDLNTGYIGQSAKPLDQGGAEVRARCRHVRNLKASSRFRWMNLKHRSQGRGDWSSIVFPSKHHTNSGLIRSQITCQRSCIPEGGTQVAINWIPRQLKTLRLATWSTQWLNQAWKPHALWSTWHPNLKGQDHRGTPWNKPKGQGWSAAKRVWYLDAWTQSNGKPRQP